MEAYRIYAITYRKNAMEAQERYPARLALRRGTQTRVDDVHVDPRRGHRLSGEGKCRGAGFLQPRLRQLVKDAGGSLGRVFGRAREEQATLLEAAQAAVEGAVVHGGVALPCGQLRKELITVQMDGSADAKTQGGSENLALVSDQADASTSTHAGNLPRPAESGARSAF